MIGAIFLVLIVIAGFNLIVASISYYDEYSTVLAERGNAEWEKVNENLNLVDVSLNSGKFNLTVENSGSFTIRLVRLWVTNETADPLWHRNFELDSFIGPKGIVTNVGQSIELYANSSNSYLLKIVTERGNKVSFRLSPASNIIPVLDLYASPMTPINDTDVSLFLAVTNRETSADAISDIIPDFNVTSSADVNVTLVEGPVPASSGVLWRGSTAFFRYIYRVSGDDGGWAFFNATIQGAPQGSYVTVNITVTTVSFAEQSSVAFSSTSFSMGSSNFGRLYWHRDTELDGYQMDNVEPPAGGSAEEIILDSSSPTVLFYEKNATYNINIPSGNWDLHLDSYRFRSCGNCESDLRITYEIVTEDGQTVVQTIEEFTYTLEGDTGWDSTTITRFESAVNITTGDRLRLNITHQSGDDLEIRFDRMSNDDAYLETPAPSPSYPAYIIYDGGDFWITVANSGNLNFWLNYQTRAVWSDINTNGSYASLLVGWQEPSGPPEYPIDEDRDSIVRKAGESIQLHFEQPRTIPTRNANDGDPIPSGTFSLMILIMGYDENGAFLVRVVSMGTITW